MMTKKFSTAALCLVIFLAGCASTPDPSPALLEAEQAYQRAKSNPDVLRYAADQIGEAEQTLRRADTAETLVDMNSLAYVANAQVQTAEAIARQEVAEARVEELALVKDRVMLENREAELASARQELAALQAKETARGTVVTLGSVLFATGRAELLPGAQSAVDRLARYLEDNSAKTVLIEGHTDSTGSDTTNLRLSQERADAVRMALIARGIGASRIAATGLGSSSPVAPNSTPEGRQQNRRVEIVIQN
jgi:outer membrane protein OmpA-like peptidoglycan-associated protein